MNKKGWSNINDFVLRNGYCCGCGVCAGVCPSHVLEMSFNEQGQYMPKLIGHCTDCGLCSTGCPFVDGNANEDEIGEKIYGHIPNIKHVVETGYFLDMLVGHVAEAEHRWQGASGGMATWFLKTLLLDEVVDHIICVTPHQDPDRLFSCEIISHPNDIIRSAKSAYYPIEFSQSIKSVLSLPGRYALIGLPCVIKAFRLASLSNKKLRERIVVYAGLTCGQLVTKGYAESVTRKMGLEPMKIKQFCFRDKAINRPANNFSMTASVSTKDVSIEWRNYCGLAWVSGMFRLRSCGFCDDIFAELADISFMDAWLPEYSSDSSGSNIVLVRSPLAERIIRERAIGTGQCDLQQISIEEVLTSQAGVLKKSVICYGIAFGWNQKRVIQYLVNA